MQRIPRRRDIVASTPYKPPVPATRKGGLRTRWYVLSAGALVGLAVAVGVALIGASSPPPVEVGFSAASPPAAGPVAPSAAPDPRLVVKRRSLHVRLVRGDEVVWRARGPVGCLSGRRLRRMRDPSRLVARGCVRLRSGAIVTLAARVPAGTRVELR